MPEDTTVDAARDLEDPDPAALSVAGGAVGTVAGLKRGGLVGAIAGGLVGGTAGYLAGAVSQAAARPSGGTTDADPIEIDVTGESSEDVSGEESADATDADRDEDDSKE